MRLPALVIPVFMVFSCAHKQQYPQKTVQQVLDEQRVLCNVQCIGHEGFAAGKSIKQSNIGLVTQCICMSGKFFFIINGTTMIEPIPLKPLKFPEAERPKVNTVRKYVRELP